MPGLVIGGCDTLPVPLSYGLQTESDPSNRIYTRDRGPLTPELFADTRNVGKCCRVVACASSVLARNPLPALPSKCERPFCCHSFRADYLETLKPSHFRSCKSLARRQYRELKLDSLQQTRGTTKELPLIHGRKAKLRGRGTCTYGKLCMKPALNASSSSERNDEHVSEMVYASVPFAPFDRQKPLRDFALNPTLSCTHKRNIGVKIEDKQAPIGIDTPVNQMIPLGAKQNGGQSAASGQNKSNNPDTTTNKRANFRGKRKRASDTRENSPDDGNDGDNGDGPGSVKRQPKFDMLNAKRFACPFFKHSPHEFKSSRSCVGPGWLSVNRVKEHVFRRHSYKAGYLRCSRCGEEFRDSSELEQHMRRPTICELRDTSSSKVEGINAQQEAALKRRQKLSHKTEEERWIEVYKIIFPDVYELPSPYYEPDNANPELEQFENRLIDTAPTLMRERLMTVLRARFGASIDSTLEREVENVIKTTLQEAVQNAHSTTPEPTEERKSLTSLDMSSYLIFDQPASHQQESNWSPQYAQFPISVPPPELPANVNLDMGSNSASVRPDDLMFDFSIFPALDSFDELPVDSKKDA